MLLANLYTSVMNSENSVGSSQLDWGSKSTVASKARTLKLSGSGT